MSNIFIVHSDFQLLMSVLIRVEVLEKSSNQLIYFNRGSEFMMHQNKYLKNLFDRILIIDEVENSSTLFYQLQNEINRFLNYIKIRKFTKKNNYQSIFTSFIEEPFESIIINSLLNSSSIINYIDEGNGSYLYYENIKDLATLHNKNKLSYKILSKIRDYSRSIYTKQIVKTIIPLRYGSSEKYKNFYVLIPELFDKSSLHKIKKINTNPLELALSELCVKTSNLDGFNFKSKKIIIIVFDGESMLAPFNKVQLQNLISSLHAYSESHNIDVIYKKHPIYNGYLEGINIPFTEIDKSIPMECLFNKFLHLDPIIIGGSSTSLALAKLLRLNTHSFYYITKNLNSVIVGIEDYFEQIKINAPKTIFDFMKSIGIGE